MAITPYATTAQFLTRYNLELIGVSSSEVNDTWMPYGAVRVNEELGRFYTIPFSSNNETAIDLNIQYSYLGILLRTRNIDDSKELKEDLTGRITALTTGNGGMALADGTMLNIDNTLNTTYSSTEDYKSTFDMRNAGDQRIDPDMLQDAWDEDLL